MIVVPSGWTAELAATATVSKLVAVNQVVGCERQTVALKGDRVGIDAVQRRDRDGDHRAVELGAVTEVGDERGEGEEPSKVCRRR